MWRFIFLCDTTFWMWRFIFLCDATLWIWHLLFYMIPHFGGAAKYFYVKPHIEFDASYILCEASLDYMFAKYFVCDAPLNMAPHIFPWLPYWMRCHILKVMFHNFMWHPILNGMQHILNVMFCILCDALFWIMCNIFWHDPHFGGAARYFYMNPHIECDASYILCNTS